MPNDVTSFASPGHLERSIFATIRYYALQELPVTATQLWRCLVLPTEEEDGTRWGGHHRYSLPEVQRAVTDSAWLRARIYQQWGYYTLPAVGAGGIAQHLRRYSLAQEKWRLVRRVARWFAQMPFVRMLAVTGSLSFGNTHPASDLDFLIVVQTGRVWTARALLLLTAALLGRRRRHWDRQAPDKACLNHYLATSALTVAPDIRNLFTAMLFTHAVPVYGNAAYHSFLEHNGPWLKRFVMYTDPLPLRSVHAVRRWAVGQGLKRVSEQWLLEPIGQWVEDRLRALQLRVIRQHTVPGRPGRIVVSDIELAFHPDSKMEGVLQRFAQDVGQRALL